MSQDVHPQEVMDWFERWTGIKFRIMPHSVQRQAIKFLKAGFTLEELEMVIAWTKYQIQRGEGGFNAGSLQWRVLFGDHGAADEFMRFQERLGLAEEARKRGWRFKSALGVPVQGKPVETAKPAMPPKPVETWEEREARLAKASAEMRKIRQSLMIGIVPEEG